LAHPACSPETEQLQFAAVVNTDTYDLLPMIQQPTLILTGTEDMLVPAENSRIMARLIPGARLIEYAGCAHGFLEESKGKVSEDILTFLDEVDSITT
jgi:pimeloyl-ACP methyl ester carboxylesterase